MLLSCGADCQNVEIEKVEWITRFENYFVDTLVNYSIVENKVNVEKSVISGSRDKIIQTITVRNTNRSYSNKFSVKFSFHCWACNGDSLWDTWNDQSDFVEISPDTTHKFSKTWYAGAYGNNNAILFDCQTEIRQSAQKIILSERIDELKITTDIVNTCGQNPEVMQEKYKTVKKLYYEHVAVDKVRIITDTVNNQDLKSSSSVKQRDVYVITKPGDGLLKIEDDH
jgi:hypothetical protein